MNPFMNINNALSDTQFSHRELRACFFMGLTDIEICDLQCRGDQHVEAVDLL